MEKLDSYYYSDFSFAHKKDLSLAGEVIKFVDTFRLQKKQKNRTVKHLLRQLAEKGYQHTWLEEDPQNSSQRGYRIFTSQGRAVVDIYFTLFGPDRSPSADFPREEPDIPIR